VVVPHQEPGQEFIIIGDRESDVYGLLASPRPAGVELLVRSAQNRKLAKEEGFLHEVLRREPPAGMLLVEVGRAQERPARQARCEVRYREVMLAPPRHADAGVPKVPVRAWAVLIDEPSPPTGEAPLHWVLIATWPIESLEEAIRAAGYYSRRWLVERFHYVLKSGCKIEASQLRTRERLERLEAVYAIIAWRLLSLTYQARLHPERPCTLVLSRQEWQVLYAHQHQRLPSETIAGGSPGMGGKAGWILGPQE
jgi:IS4 transposase